MKFDMYVKYIYIYIYIISLLFFLKFTFNKKKKTHIQKEIEEFPSKLVWK